MNKPLHKNRTFLICILLLVVTFAVYWPVHSYEFVRYDDDTSVTENRYVKVGLSSEGIRWAFTTGHASNWHPLTWLAHLLDKKSETEKAIKLYEKAIALEPKNIIAHGRLGLALHKVDRIDEAIEEFRIVLKARPDDVEMHCNVGYLLERKGQIDDAIKHYRRALQIKPDDARARKRLESALGKQKKLL